MSNPISNLANMQRSEFPITRTDRKPGIDKQDGPAPRVDGPDFADAFADAINKASADDRIASEMEQNFAAGDPNVGIHEVVIASEKANLSLRYSVTLKNKLLEAYRDIMSTQV
jgi:flagellar hook-basal body complex protein FliE